MKIKEETSICSYPEIKEKHPSGCSLNQIIKCHGDQPLSKLLRHLELENKEE